MANQVLAGLSDYGESRETLETTWESWIHHLPFDTLVGTALDRLYRTRLAKLDPEKDKALYIRLERHRALLEKRTERYRKSQFLPGTGTVAGTPEG